MIQLDKVSKKLGIFELKDISFSLPAELRAETVQERQHCYICFRGCISLTAER